MNVTIVSGYRERLIDHLRNAIDALEAGADHYRCSTISVRGGATDLVFEVDPALREGRDTHLIVQEVDGLLQGRPCDWVAGESMR